jgi:hypothetical protein
MENDVNNRLDATAVAWVSELKDADPCLLAHEVSELSKYGDLGQRLLLEATDRLEDFAYEQRSRLLVDEQARAVKLISDLLSYPILERDAGLQPATLNIEQCRTKKAAELEVLLSSIVQRTQQQFEALQTAYEAKNAQFDLFKPE